MGRVRGWDCHARAGQSATADVLASQLQDALGGRDRHLADVLDGQRLLLIVDDVWDQELVVTLRASLPPTVTVLATTRGVSVPGAAAVQVGAVGMRRPSRSWRVTQRVPATWTVPWLTWPRPSSTGRCC